MSKEMMMRRALFLVVLLALSWASTAHALLFSENYNVTQGTMCSLGSPTQPVLDLMARGWTFGAGTSCVGYDIAMIVPAPAGMSGSALRFEYRGQATGIQDHDYKFARTWTPQTHLFEKFLVRYEPVDSSQPYSFVGGGAGSHKMHYFNAGGNGYPWYVMGMFQVCYTAMCVATPLPSPADIPPTIAPGTMPFNQTVCMETEIKMNNPRGAANGIARVWMNGQLYLEKTDVIWLTASDPGGTIGYMQVYRQDGNNLYRYEDDYQLDTVRIGCSGSSSDSTPPAPPTGVTIQ